MISASDNYSLSSDQDTN